MVKYKNGIHMDSEPGYKEFMKDKAKKAAIKDLIIKKMALTSKVRSTGQELGKKMKEYFDIE